MDFRKPMLMITNLSVIQWMTLAIYVNCFFANHAGKFYDNSMDMRVRAEEPQPRFERNGVRQLWKESREPNGRLLGDETQPTRPETPMLTLFVVQSCADPKDPDRSVKSFDGLADEIYFVPNIQAINEATVANEWYAVIYDDEHIDEQLMEGLKVFVKESHADMLILMKKSKNGYFRGPRLFRQNVILRWDTLLPEKADLSFDTVLNGLIHDNDQV